MTGPKLLILTVGLPKSGKSTWARQTGLPIVNPDAIRLALHGQRYYGPAEPHVWAIAHTMVDALFMAGHPTVIVDACNNTDKRRQEWVSHQAEVRLKIFHTPPEECLDRAVAQQDHNIEPVIRRMAEESDWEVSGALSWPQVDY